MMPPEELLEQKSDFLRSVGQILSCIVRFQLNDRGTPRVEPVYDVYLNSKVRMVKCMLAAAKLELSAGFLHRVRIVKLPIQHDVRSDFGPPLTAARLLLRRFQRVILRS